MSTVAHHHWFVRFVVRIVVIQWWVFPVTMSWSPATFHPFYTKSVKRKFIQFIVILWMDTQRNNNNNNEKWNCVWYTRIVSLIRPPATWKIKLRLMKFQHHNSIEAQSDRTRAKETSREKNKKIIIEDYQHSVFFSTVFHSSSFCWFRCSSILSVFFIRFDLIIAHYP